MGRKGRFNRKKGQRVREIQEAPVGPTRSTVRIALGLSAIVALALLTLVILNPGWYSHTSDDGTHVITPNPNKVLPTPRASAIPSDVVVGEPISIDGSSSHAAGSGNIVNYTWDFHKQNESGPIILKRYDRKFNFTSNKSGIFYVILTVRDDSGLSNSTISRNRYGGLTLIVRNAMPVAEAGPDVLGLVGIPLHLDGTKSYDTLGKIVNYTWDFGDGTKGYGAEVNHTYAHLATVYVILTVVDDRGYDNWDTVLVDVKA